MEKYVALRQEELPPTYDQLEIPVVRTSQRRATQDWDRSAMRHAHYYIEHQDEYVLNEGKPYGLVSIGYRTLSHPDHFGTYCSHYYPTLSEARFRAQLATWFYVKGDRQAEDTVLADYDRCCDLRVLDLIHQAETMGASVDNADLMRFAHSVSALSFLAPMPTGEELNDLVCTGGDWRALWTQALPPDPLGLVVWMEHAPFPSINWFATVRRVAATVVDRVNGTLLSNACDGLRLLQRFSLPVPDLAFTVMFDVLVQMGGASFVNRGGPDWPYVNRNCIEWRGDPFPHAASVPPCGCCGQPRALSGWCGGLTYGDWEDKAHHRFMECPFDRYGCRGNSSRFDCCHCVEINHLRYTREMAGTPMTVQVIEDEIARHQAMMELAGRSPFPARRRKGRNLAELV